jgi:hypothetical protein
MVNRKISPDVKLAAIRLHEQGILRLRVVLLHFGNRKDRNVVCDD